MAQPQLQPLAPPRPVINSKSVALARVASEAAGPGRAQRQHENCIQIEFELKMKMKITYYWRSPCAAQ